MTDAPPNDIGDAAPVGVGRSPLSDGGWHRLHPLTPLFRGGLVIVVAAGIVLANLRERVFLFLLPEDGPDAEYGVGAPDPVEFVLANDLLVAALLGVLGVLVVLVGLFSLSWRFHSFRITGDDVEVRSGVVFRTHRRAPLDRVQGVNLVRPMPARLCGLAKLEVMGAGNDANVKLEYLSAANAEAVRRDILRLASGRGLAAPGTIAPGRGRAAAAAEAIGAGFTGLVDGVDGDDAARGSVVTIPLGRLVASRVLSVSTVFLVAAIVVLVVSAVHGGAWTLFAFVPAVLGFGAYWVRQIVRALRYTVAPSPNGVRLTFGFFTTTTEIIPPGRVHAVQVSQSILWRPFGWWSMSVNRLSGGDSESRQNQLFPLLPVGTLADVERILHLALPGLPVAGWVDVVSHGTRRPRDGDPFTNTPRRARVLRPLSWRRNGFLFTEDALILRRGWAWRKLVILPLARLQSVQLAQGPIARGFGVANARAHTIAGPVGGGLRAIDRQDAVRLFTAAASGAVRVAASDRSHRWAGEET